MGFALALNQFAFAQERPDAGTILQEQTKERPKLPPKDAPQVLPPTEVRPAQRIEPTIKLQVSAFRVTGNTVYPEKELLAQLRAFSGKELDANGLIDAADTIKSYYRQNGYFLAQAYLPRQELKMGAGNVVEISVIEGRIGKVDANVTAEARISKSLIENIMKSSLEPGDPITERGLERPLLIVSDLPGVAVRSEIRPGGAVGLADVTANVTGKPGNVVDGFVDVDNHGSRFIGEHRVGLSMNINNPLKLGDQLSARVIGAEASAFWFARVAYAMPVGYYGTRVGIAYNEFDYTLGQPEFVNLKAHGQGLVRSVYGFHPLVRSRSANVILQAAIEDKNLVDKTDSTSAIEERKIVALKIGAVGDWRDTILGGSLNSFSVIYTDGDLDIRPNSVRITDQGTTGLRTQGSFNKFNYDFRRLQKVSNEVTFLFSAQGQFANKNLASAERFSLGGATGVRGYPSGEANGNEGHIFSGELRYLMPKFTSLLPGDATVSAFYDVGTVKIDDAPQQTPSRNRRNLSSWGLGFTIGQDNNYVIRSTVAFKLENERATADGTSRDPRLWVQGIKWF
ncbi:MAG: BamA/TamA family outer membrane protein [Proteobacteria bacterium]|nr:BamA/TamA family outer membrane protein [Pseudomonadota bacterium]